MAGTGRGKCMNLNLRMSFSMHLIMVRSPTLVANNWAKAKSVHRKKAGRRCTGKGTHLS